MSPTPPDTHQDSFSMEKKLNDSDSAPAPVPAEVSEELHFTENKSAADVGPSEEQDAMNHERMRFAKVRDGLAGWQWGLFHVLIFFGAMLSGYDVSNVATIQVSIYRAYGHIDLLPWVVTAFSLGNAATNPIFDQIMKLVDLKWFTLGSWMLFVVGTAVTGASPTIEGVIVGRTLLGIAGGAGYIALLTYNTILAKPAEHARVNGLIGMGFAVGIIIGPIIGGAFAENEHATWRWAFYICLPWLAILILLTLLACPNVRLRPQQSVLKGLGQIDWVGAGLHIATLVLFDAACIFSGSTLPWNSGVIAIWVLFGVFLSLYTVQQSLSLFTVPTRRILPIGVMTHRTGLLVMLCTVFAACGYGIALYYLPLFYAFTRGDDAIQTAVHMLPYICVYIAAVIGSGVFLPMVRRYAALYVVGGVLIAAGSGAMMSVNQDTSLSQTMGIGAIIGFGVGLTMQLGASIMALALPDNIRMDSSIAMSLALYTGTTVALAIAGCIFQNIGFQFLSEALSGSGFSAAEIHEALAGVESPIWAASNGADLRAAIAAVTSAIIRLFYLSTVAGALMVVSAFVMKWEALDFKKTAKKKATVEDGQQTA